MSTGKQVRNEKRSRRPRLEMETLEDRTTPTVSGVLNGGLLTVSLSSPADAATLGGQLASGNFITLAGTGNGGQSFSNVTDIAVNNTSGTAGTQGVRFQDVNNGSGRIILTGSLTVSGVDTVDFNNPLLPLIASSVSISGGRFVTNTGNLPQLAVGGAITIAASGSDSTTGDAVGTAAKPIRIASAGSLAVDTFAGGGHQHFDLAGDSVNVNGATTGLIRAFTGTVNLTNGRFLGQGNDDFGNNTSFHLGTGAVFGILNTESIAGLSGIGIAQGAGTLVLGNNNASSVFDGTISSAGGGLNLTKKGTGTIALNGVNTYTGATAVTAGRLLVNGSLSASSAVTVSGNDPNASTFLGGTGTINGPVQVQAGGVIGPGSAPVPGDVGTGTLSTGSLSFQTGGAFGVKIVNNSPGFFDALNVTGTVNLVNGSIFAFAISVPPVGAVLTVISNDGTDPVVGTFTGLPEGATFRDSAGVTYRVSYVGGTGNDVTLTALAGLPLQSLLAGTGPTNGTGTLFGPTNGVYAAGGQVTLVPGFSGETHVAVGDVNGDRIPDIIVGTGPGNSRIRVLDGSSDLAAAPVVLADFTAFTGYAGGVFVAVGDLTGDGFDDIAVAPDAVDAFSGPVSNQLPVRVYGGSSLRNATANPMLVAAFDGLASLSGASGQGNPLVKLGGRPAIADVNNDGRPDLLIAAGSGGGPRITIWPGTGFDGANGGAPTANPIANLFVFESTQRGGAFLTAGDINGDGFADIAVGGGPGGGPRIRIVNSAFLLGLPNLEGVNLDDPANLGNGLVLNNYFAGSAGNRGGVRVTMRDADGDSLADLVIGSGTGEQSAIRIYSDASLAAVFGTSTEPSGPQVLDPFSAVLAGGVWIG